MSEKISASTGLDEFELYGAELEAVSEMTSFLVNFARFDRVIQKTRELIAFNKINQAPEPQSLMVLSPSGGGKTVLFETILSQLEQPYEEKVGFDLVRRVPYFKSSIPTTATPATMAQQLYSSMGLGTSNKAGIEQRIKAALQQAKTNALFYDELHNVVINRPTAYRMAQARGWIRDLISTTRVMVVAFGTPECKDYFLADAQFHKRFPWVIELKPFKFDLDPKSEYCSVVKAFERQLLKYKDLFEFIEPRLNEKFLISLYASTGGSINGIKAFYVAVMRLAFQTDHIFNTEKFSLIADEISLEDVIVRNGFDEDREICLNKIANRQMNRFV